MPQTSRPKVAAHCFGIVSLSGSGSPGFHLALAKHACHAEAVWFDEFRLVADCSFADGIAATATAPATTLMAPMANAHSAPISLTGEFAAPRSRSRSRSAEADDFTRQMLTNRIDRLSVVGTPEDWAMAISVLHDAGDESVALVPQVEPATEQTRWAARQIRPLLR